MKSHVTSIGVAFAIVAAVAVNSVFAQQAAAKRNFEAEIRAALQSAKTAAGFEFLGTLVRTCLLASERRRRHEGQCAGLCHEPRQCAGA